MDRDIHNLEVLSLVFGNQYSFKQEHILRYIQNIKFKIHNKQLDKFIDESTDNINSVNLALEEHS